MAIKSLTPRQANALQMTLDGYAKQEIQERLGINQATLWRWRKLPAWNETVSVVLRDASGDGQGQIKSMLPLATRRLKQLIHSTTETVALGACRTVLEAHANLVAREQDQAVMAELEERLEELQAVARNHGFMAQPMGCNSCAPVISAGTQEVAAASVDVDLEPSNPVEEGQIGLFGPGAGQDRAINTPITPHTHEGGEG